MVKTIKLKRGLDINLAGVAARNKKQAPSADRYALMPSSFTGVVPKVVVKEGDEVKAGTCLFVNKNYQIVEVENL